MVWDFVICVPEFYLFLTDLTHKTKHLVYTRILKIDKFF
ncbi:hypothetical protein PUN28_019440 [Cardiocondyla obscurior]|uniref:Uncharacterized protein n=1 Tax=Cardiocondyla obscurior TaxID=286306 RepID=A0AAW2EBG0_9HYME